MTKTKVAATKPAKAKKVVKSIIGHHRTVQLSPTMVLEEYTYVYIDGVTSNRTRDNFAETRRKGWVKKAEDQEVIKKNGGGLWIKRYIYQKPAKPRPRKPKAN